MDINKAILPEEYKKKKKEIKKRLNDFSKVKGDKIFYELCFCLLTPQSKAENCDFAVSKLKERNFLKKKFNPKRYLLGKVRFHNNKSKYLLGMKLKYNEVAKRVAKFGGRELREWLIQNIKGLGYKEASHFLRNIGFRNLAILDRHILKNLKKHGAIKEVPKTLTRKRYLEIEKRFHSFSAEMNIPLDEMDLLFWSRETGKIFK